jgi:hypothetical protein
MNASHFFKYLLPAFGNSPTWIDVQPISGRIRGGILKTSFVKILLKSDDYFFTNASSPAVCPLHTREILLKIISTNKTFIAD